jgi:hypothetical protein
MQSFNPSIFSNYNKLPPNIYDLFQSAYVPQNICDASQNSYFLQNIYFPENAYSTVGIYSNFLRPEIIDHLTAKMMFENVDLYNNNIRNNNDWAHWAADLIG